MGRSHPPIYRRAVWDRDLEETDLRCGPLPAHQSDVRWERQLGYAVSEAYTGSALGLIALRCAQEHDTLIPLSMAIVEMDHGRLPRVKDLQLHSNPRRVVDAEDGA